MTSQKTLLAFAIVSVVVSLLSLLAVVEVWGNFNDWLALSPGDTLNQSKATVNITIQSSILIKFINDTISWAPGTVDTTAGDYANLTSQGQFTRWLNISATNVSNGFVLENVGNSNVTLWIKTDKNATGFIMDNGAGSSSPSSYPIAFLYMVTNCGPNGNTWCNPATMRQGTLNDTADSCGSIITPLNQWRDVNASVGQLPSYLGDRICNQFGWVDNADEVRIDIGVVIPRDAPVASKGAIMTAQAEAAP